MACYPGWNAFDPDRVGHDWARNFICDLLSAVTPDGRDNLLGALLMTSAVVVLVFGQLLALWWRSACGSRWLPAVRVCSLVACAGVLTVCAEQVLSLELPHGPLTMGVAAFGALPTAVVMVGDWRSNVLWTRIAIAAFGIAASTNAISYAIAMAVGEPNVVIPIAQKVAVLAMLAWLGLRRQMPVEKWMPRTQA